MQASHVVVVEKLQVRKEDRMGRRQNVVGLHLHAAVAASVTRKNVGPREHEAGHANRLILGPSSRDHSLGI